MPDGSSYAPPVGHAPDSSASDAHASDARRSSPAGARARVFGLVACFVAGLAAGNAAGVDVSWPWWAASGVCGIIAACCAWTRWWIVPILAATVCMGAAWHVTRVIESRAGTFAARLDREGTAEPLVRLRGVTLSSPSAAPPPPGRLARFSPRPPAHRFTLDVDAIEHEGAWLPTTGRVWVRVAGEPPESLKAGDRVEALGRFSAIEPAANPGETNVAAIAATRGYCGTLHLSDGSLARPLATPEGMTDRLRSWRLATLDSLRNRARGVLLDAAGGDPAVRSLLLGLMLGEFDASQREIIEAFTRQSLVHVLSISGFHLSVMAGLALVLLRLTGDRGWLEPLAVGVLVVLYASIVPPQSPILRSAMMISLIIAGELMSRRYDRLTLLGWIALLLLVRDPMEAWSLGFQLSVGLTASLLWLTPHVREAMRPSPLRGTIRSDHRRVRDRIADGFATAVAANVSCWLVSVPVLAARAGLFSPLAVLTGLLLTPLATMLLWVGFLSLLAGTLVPGAATWASGVIHLLASSTIDLVRWFDALPGSSVRVPPISWAWTLTTTAAVALALRFGLTGSWPARRRWTATAAAAGCGVWLVVEWAAGTGLAGRTALRVDTLAVGDGTCHLLRSGQDVVLWDAAGPNMGGPFSPIVAAARRLGVRAAPVAVITHPDLDHFGSILDVAGPLGVRRVVVPPRFLVEAERRPQGAAAAALAGLRDAGIEVGTVARGDRIALGSSVMEFLWPDRGFDGSEDNDHSLAGVVSSTLFGDQPMLLLTGDVEAGAIGQLRESWPSLRPVVAEAPHHGSARPESIEWVGDWLQPRIVLQSSGPRRLDDARWEHVRRDRTWYCTARDGAVFVEFHAGGRVHHGSFRGAVP
jgi:competence protein ComEC